MQDEIKSRLKSGNACCHSVQNILSSRLLSKNININMYKIIILLFVLYGCETQYCSGDQIEKNEIGGGMKHVWGEEKYIRVQGFDRET
jgi:hypothetical protein